MTSSGVILPKKLGIMFALENSRLKTILGIFQEVDFGSILLWCSKDLFVQGGEQLYTIIHQIALLWGIVPDTHYVQVTYNT